MENENKKESTVKRITKNKYVRIATVILAVGIVVGGAAYWKTTSARVYIETSDIEAPAINLSPTQSGIIQNIMVNPGDQVAANTIVAQVGNELIKTKIAGIVISTENSIGKSVSPADVVVAMIDPSTLRVVGHLDENKGLSDIHVGDPAVFTVDAFGSKSYNGVVDEISPTARTGDIVFSISDKRPTEIFDVKVRFDPQAYPEIKNGMSAKLWVYKQ